MKYPRRVVPAAEFDRPAGHLDAPGLPAVRFPETGRPEADVIDDVRGRFDEDRFEPDRNFSITYSGIPSAISQEVEALARGRFFVEWARESEIGTWSMEREAVAMMASLLGGDAGTGGFITTGGTESNLAAMRLARNLGMKVVEVDVDDDTYLPRIEDVEAAITPQTVGLVCSAPGGSFGVLDPVEAFADLARRTGLYLHVDAAFGGFILPFMRDLGYDIPPFDLSLPGVCSISTDGHKLGLLPIATGFFLVRDAAILESIPTERTLIHTTSSTKPGSRAAAAWATLRHMGREGYVRSTAHVLGLADIIAEGVTAIDGMALAAPRFISILGFTSSSIDLEVVHRLMAEAGWGQGYGVTRGMPFIRLSIHPSRSVEAAHGFVAAFEDAVARSRRG